MHPTGLRYVHLTMLGSQKKHFTQTPMKRLLKRICSARENYIFSIERCLTLPRTCADTVPPCGLEALLCVVLCYTVPHPGAPMCRRRLALCFCGCVVCAFVPNGSSSQCDHVPSPCRFEVVLCVVFCQMVPHHNAIISRHRATSWFCSRVVCGFVPNGASSKCDRALTPCRFAVLKLCSV